MNSVKQFESPIPILGLEWVDPFFSAGHWVPEQIESIGGRSALGSPKENSRTLSIDEIVQSNPEIIIVLCCGFGLNENIQFAKKLYTNPQLSSMRAIQNEQVWAVDANSYCSRPTLRVIDGSLHFAQGLRAGGIEGVIQKITR